MVGHIGPKNKRRKNTLCRRLRLNSGYNFIAVPSSYRLSLRLRHIRAFTSGIRDVYQLYRTELYKNESVARKFVM